MTTNVGSIAEIDSVRDYLNRIGAEVRSVRTAIVREEHGSYWKDLCIITFSTDGDIVCRDERYAPTDAERARIKSDFKDKTWPQSNRIVGRVKMPEEMLKGLEPDEVEDAVFEFRNARGEFVMYQKRVKFKKTGDKAYLPWTYWDDGTWRQLEPTGPLPLWGIEHVQGHDTVFVHEGAKAARHMHNVIHGKGAKWEKVRKAFPWTDEMSNAAHVGWIGGALNPGRTDWSELETLGVKRVIVVADNDMPGVLALRDISQNLNLPTLAIKFSGLWPNSFDLADPWPEDMFRQTDEGQRVYVGPAFHDCLKDITWATNAAPPLKGHSKPVLSIRDTFLHQWIYAQNTGLFVSTHNPRLKLDEMSFNKHMSAFSHTHELSKLMHKVDAIKAGEMVYQPDHKERIITMPDRGLCVNAHLPTQVKPLKGDPKPWLDFMEYFIPKAEDRKELLKWCATLIAKPEVRMSYGVLLVSEKQGMGKTTLAAHILAKLVGRQNTDWPSEKDVVDSAFNDWIAEKRLIIINEIYSGHSWKAYNTLKSYITDKDLRVNIKYQKPYVIENWAHMFACSNSERPLKMDENDRRWFHPSVTKVKWPKKNFDDFYDWLDRGGLGIIMHWALNYGDYVRPSDPSPMSGAKMDLIFESYTKAQKEVAALGMAINARKTPTAVATDAVETWVKKRIDRDEIGASGHEMRKSMRQTGCKQFDERVQVKGRVQYVIMNDAAAAKLDEIEGRHEKINELRKWIINPELIVEDEL